MIPLSYRPGGNMNILLISLPEKNKDMKLDVDGNFRWQYKDFVACL